MSLGRACFPNRILMCSPYFAQAANSESFRPDILLDISVEVEMKHRLIDMHSSQEPEFWSGMARGIETLYGMQAGVTAAEPFETDRFYTSPRAKAWI
jgi:LmbE family N-acetylglucosaminyl deacetylase